LVQRNRYGGDWVLPKGKLLEGENFADAALREVRRMALLEQMGIFDPLMMQMLKRQSEHLRAGANSHLLGAMRRIEERDRERFSQPPTE
jgi:ADP-ribose pyrophosphatase YjhB (NUDIX family)